MGDAGLETLADSRWKTAKSTRGDAPDDAVSAPPAVLAGDDPGLTDPTRSRRPALAGNDPALARLLAVWPELSAEDHDALADHAEAIAAGRLPVGSNSLP